MSRLSADALTMALVDGRSISVHLAWFPRPLDATPEQRTRGKLTGAGYGIHWPDLDEDLGVEGLLRDTPVARATVLTRLTPHELANSGQLAQASCPRNYIPANTLGGSGDR